MKAIVHIGTEKTGTTSIQRFLYLNRRKLKKAGFHFIQSAGKTNNRALPAYCISEERFDDFFRAEGIRTPEAKQDFKKHFLQTFESEIKSASPNTHTFIMSSEHFHSRIRTPEEMDNVYRFLSTYFDEFKIICYLREQVSTCTSYYSTHLKSGGTDSFAAFLRRCKPGNYYFNYYELLANWERCFGLEALDVALFSPDRFLHNDLLDDFTARIDPALLGTLNKSIQSENESLKPAGQALARAVNIIFPVTSEEADVTGMRDRCKKIIMQQMTGRGQQPTPEVRASIYGSFIDSNRELQKKFFPHEETIFPPPADEPASVNTIDESDFAVVANVLSLISKQGKGLLSNDAHMKACTTIFSCISDITRPLGEEPGREVTMAGVKVVLTDEDAIFLRRAALRIEGRDIKAAFRLMTLSGEVRPNSQAIKAKLEKYRERLDQAPKPQFLLSFHPAAVRKDVDEKKLVKLYQRWLASLSVPGGSPLNGLFETRTVNPDGTVIEPGSIGMESYSIIEADSLEEAVAIARECPYLETGGTINVSRLIYPGIG
ncbi:MAG: hypothetical protein R3E50_14235 [Halioglobus sp.]